MTRYVGRKPLAPIQAEALAKIDEAFRERRMAAYGRSALNIDVHLIKLAEARAGSDWSPVLDAEARALGVDRSAVIQAVLEAHRDAGMAVADLEAQRQRLQDAVRAATSAEGVNAALEALTVNA